MLNLTFNIAYYQWIILACIVVSFSISYFFYRKNNGALEEVFERKPFLRYILIALRCSTILGLLLLLLNPILQFAYQQTEKPKIVIALDNSSSIKLGFGDQQNFDSTKFESFHQSLSNLGTDLREQFEVDFVHFSSVVKNGLTKDLSGKTTNYSNLLNDISNQYSGQNINSLVIASDGIYNKGIHPQYNNHQGKFSIYTIGLGDTSLKKDISVQKVLYNPVAYYKNDFEIIAQIQNQNNTENSNIELIRVGKNKEEQLVKKQDLKLNSPTKEVKFKVPANYKGLQHYKVRIQQLEEEALYTNNEQSFFIDIMDNKQKIAIFYSSPHPDIKAIKLALSKHQSYEVLDFNEKKEIESLKGIDLAILHQTNKKESKYFNLTERLSREGIPSLIITGNQSDILGINKSQQFINIQPGRKSFNDVTPVLNEDFLSFNLSENTLFTLSHLPPLKALANSIKSNPKTNTLFFQKIGNVATNYPLLSFHQNLNFKQGILLGEGLWKWKLHDYLLNKNHNATDEIWQKTVQYLAQHSDKRKFCVNSMKNNYNENENIEFTAQLYNDNYELVKNQSIQLTLISNSGQEYPYTIPPQNDQYSLNIGSLPVGIYQFKASCNYNQENHLIRGEISVTPVQLEALNIQADHHLLKQLANSYDGDFFTPEELDKLKQTILNRKDIKSLSYNKYETNAVINLLWLFTLLILPLSAEWFLRKWLGSY